MGGWCSGQGAAIYNHSAQGKVSNTVRSSLSLKSVNTPQRRKTAALSQSREWDKTAHADTHAPTHANGLGFKWICIDLLSSMQRKKKFQRLSTPDTDLG